MSLLIIIRILNVSDQNSRENQNTLFCSIIFFSENHVVYEMVLWNAVVELDRPQMTVQYGAHVYHAR